MLVQSWLFDHVLVVLVDLVAVCKLVLSLQSDPALVVMVDLAVQQCANMSSPCCLILHWWSWWTLGCAAVCKLDQSLLAKSCGDEGLSAAQCKHSAHSLGAALVTRWTHEHATAQVQSLLTASW